MPTKKLEESILNLEILARELDIKAVFITKHWEEEIIDNILQGNGEFTDGKKERMKKGRPMAHQMSMAFSIPENFKIPRDRHWLQDPGAL